MSRRGRPYPKAGFRLCLPDRIWQDALDVLRKYGGLGGGAFGRGSEGLVYLGGVVAEQELIVTGLFVIEHEPQGDEVVVGATEARWLLRTLRARDEELIAQIHSHRGRAGHSDGDDAHATSFHEGFVSIVVPRFAAQTITVQECAVLEFSAGSFRELTSEQVARRIAVHPQTVRRPSATSIPHTNREEESLWTRFGRRLRQTARRQRSPDAG